MFWWTLNVPTGPISEFKGSVRHVHKGHPTLVTQIDLILQNWWEFKVLMTITVNKLSSCSHLLRYTAHFKNRFFRISGNGRRRNLDNFYFFLFSLKSYTCHNQSVKSTEKNFKTFFRNLLTMVGQQKFWFLKRPKCLFHHSKNTSFSKRLTKEAKAQVINGQFSSKKYEPANELYKGTETLSSWS